MILNSPTISGSLTVTGNILTSGSITLSGSIASASYALSASNAQTASFANAFTVAGNLTAQTLVVQTITSSVDFVTGSTRFGSISANTHVFTGSIFTSGSVGIGTSSPTKALEILSNTSQDGIKISGASNPRLTIIDTTNSVQFDALTTDTEAVLRTDTNHPLHLSTNGTVRLIISASGDTTFSISSNKRISTYTPSSWTGISDYVTSGVGWQFTRPNDDVFAHAIFSFNGTSTNNLAISSRSDLVVATGGGLGSADERMRITSGGNVGIGTSAAANAKFNVYMNETDATYGSKIQAVFGPSTYLDSDATNIYGGGTSETQFTVGNTARPAMLSLGGNVNTGEGIGVINFFRSSNTDGYRSRVQIQTGLNTTGTANQHGGFLAISTAADGGTNPQERMRIGSTGNITLSSKDTNISINEMLQGSISYYRANLDDDHTAVKILNGSYTFNTYLIDIVLTNGDSVDAYATIWANIQGNTQVSSTIIGGLNTGYFTIINETSAPPTGTDGKFNIILNGEDGDSWFYVRNRLGGTRRTAIMIKQFLPR